MEYSSIVFHLKAKGFIGFSRLTMCRSHGWKKIKASCLPAGRITIGYLKKSAGRNTRTTVRDARGTILAIHSPP